MIIKQCLFNNMHADLCQKTQCIEQGYKPYCVFDYRDSKCRCPECEDQKTPQECEKTSCADPYKKKTKCRLVVDRSRKQCSNIIVILLVGGCGTLIQPVSAPSMRVQSTRNQQQDTVMTRREPSNYYILYNKEHQYYYLKFSCPDIVI